jgi:hypothetical protein
LRQRLGETQNHSQQPGNPGCGQIAYTDKCRLPGP